MEQKVFLKIRKMCGKKKEEKEEKSTSWHHRNWGRAYHGLNITNCLLVQKNTCKFLLNNSVWASPCLQASGFLFYWETSQLLIEILGLFLLVYRIWFSLLIYNKELRLTSGRTGIIFRFFTVLFQPPYCSSPWEVICFVCLFLF